jgi:hypothetical protein
MAREGGGGCKKRPTPEDSNSTAQHSQRTTKFGRMNGRAEGRRARHSGPAPPLFPPLLPFLFPCVSPPSPVLPPPSLPPPSACETALFPRRQHGERLHRMGARTGRRRGGENRNRERGTGVRVPSIPAISLSVADRRREGSAKIHARERKRNSSHEVIEKGEVQKS